MKKILSIILSIVIIFGLFPVAGLIFALANENSESEEYFYTPSTYDQRNEEGKYLILNEDGSYGGSYLDAKYGKGAPYNGEYDVADSDYYTVNSDYYNMNSTEERKIFPKFSSYQQTMADTSGIACLMDILNYMGEDVKGKYSEVELLKRYEQINNQEVYQNGTTVNGLKALVEDLGLGYTAKQEGLGITSSDNKDNKIAKTKTFLKQSVENSKFVLVRYQSPNGYGWKLVIGYDTLGTITKTVNVAPRVTDAVGDDVVIFAEPNDGFDHCQDGYATERLQDFSVWWRKTDVTGTTKETYSYLVIDANIKLDFDVQPVDETIKQTLYDLHLPLNPDGSYGGTRNYTLYGTITSGKGWWDHREANYYKINDFYNMGSEGSRLLLKNYTVLQQTMASSCGICAVNSIMKYYGHESSYYDLELEYLIDYEAITGATVKGKGTSVVNHKKTLTALGYNSYSYSSAYGEVPRYDTYEKYAEFVKYNISNGRPIAVSTNLGSGHYLTIIGIDDMGTDYIYDDVLIIADSCDYWDHYQDGYNIYSAYKFYTQHANGAFSLFQAHIIIYDKN